MAFPSLPQLGGAMSPAWSSHPGLIFKGKGRALPFPSPSPLAMSLFKFLFFPFFLFESGSNKAHMLQLVDTLLKSL